MVHHPSRHLCSSPIPLGFLEAPCQQDSFVPFPIHSHNGRREELQTPKAPRLPSEHGFRDSGFLSLMASPVMLEGTREQDWKDALSASTQLIGTELCPQNRVKVQTAVLPLKFFSSFRVEKGEREREHHLCRAYSVSPSPPLPLEKIAEGG